MNILDRYEIVQELGTGSMGIIYRARDKSLDRFVAVKVMRPEFQLDNETLERFRREARACAQLQHPNIVTVYDLAEGDGGVTYIIMELLEGTDLRTAMRKKIPLPVSLKVELMAQICDGLAHAHKHGIVHRDIKPTNLFLHLRNRAKILDFGVARLTSSNLTRTGKILGTPNYMAPEQITGLKCDFRSDLFSTAIVAFELVAGSHPFQAPFIPKRIANDEPDRLRDVDPRLPPQLEQALERALAKDPAERFTTAEEFAAALREVLSSGELDEIGGNDSAASQEEYRDGDMSTTATMIEPSGGAGEEGTKTELN